MTAAAAAVLPPAAHGQTSGTLGTQTSTTWATAPWAIIAGTGPYPDGGGTATFAAAVATVPGVLDRPASTGSTAVTLDVPITLSRVTFDSPYGYGIGGPAADPLTLDATAGGTFDVERSPTPTSIFRSTHAVSATLAGGGSAGLTKVGQGSLTLYAANTYTGGTHVNAGTLQVYATAAVADGVFGDAGAGISLDGGTLLTSVPGGFNTSRGITLGPGGGTLQTLVGTGANLAGVISGPGGLTYELAAGGATPVGVTLSAADTFAGPTTIWSYPGLTVASLSGGPDVAELSQVTLAGGGSIRSTSALDVSGTLALDDSAANVADRIADAAPFTLRGGDLTLIANAAARPAATAETVGPTTLAGGMSQVQSNLANGSATQQAVLTLASLTRSDAGLLYVHGRNLGGTPGPGVANVRLAGAAPTLVGGAGPAGSTTVSIVPWAVGDTDPVYNVGEAMAGASLVTYDATAGFRPLAASEYSANFAGGPTANVSLTGGTVIGTVNANALRFAPTGTGGGSLTFGGTGGTINIASGAFLYAPQYSGNGMVGVGLNFGSAEGVVTNTNPITLYGTLAGSAGVTYGDPATAKLTLPTVTLYQSLSAANPASTYTGDTRIVAGVVLYKGTVAAAGTPGPFGLSGTVVLDGGPTGAALLTGDSSALNRDLLVTGGGQNQLVLLHGSSATVAAYNGAVTLDSDLQTYTVTGGTIAVNGPVAGPGGLLVTGSLTLTGSNAYAGGTTVDGAVLVGSDAALGTGPLRLAGQSAYSSSIAGVGTAPRTLANPVVLQSPSNVIAGSAPLTFTGPVDLNGTTTLSVSAPLVTMAGTVDHGGLVKAGTGTLVLTANNAYTGGTNVSAGTVRVNNAVGSGTGPGTVLVAAGGTLGGTGTIAGPVLVGNGGTITAGADDVTAGTLTTGPQTWSGNASSGGYTAKITAAGSDRLVLSGLTLEGVMNYRPVRP